MMANISMPTTFTALTVAKSAEVNANFSTIVTVWNTYAVQKDTTGTIAAVHTYSVSPIFSFGTASQTLELDGSKSIVTAAITGTGSYVKSASPTLTGTITAAALTLSGLVTAGGVTSTAAVTANVNGVGGAFNGSAGSDAALLTFLSFQRLTVEKGWVGFGDGASSRMRVNNIIGDVWINGLTGSGLYVNGSSIVAAVAAGATVTGTLTTSGAINGQTISAAAALTGSLAITGALTGVTTAAIGTTAGTLVVTASANVALPISALGGPATGNFKSSDGVDNAPSRWTFGRDNVTTGDFVWAINGTARGSIAGTSGNWSLPASLAITGALTGVTTLGATGAITRTVPVATDSTILNSTTSTTGGQVISWVSTGGTYGIGSENSAGTYQGVTAYDLFLLIPSARGVSFLVAGGGTPLRVSTSLVAVAGVVTVSAGATTNALTVTTTGAIQQSLRYDASNRLDFTVSSAGYVTLTAVGASNSMRFDCAAVSVNHATLPLIGFEVAGSINVSVGVISGVMKYRTDVAMSHQFDVNGNNARFRIGASSIESLTAHSFSGTSASVAAATISVGGITRTTIGANGAATALTANPVGYIDIYVAGTACQIPYYTRGA